MAIHPPDLPIVRNAPEDIRIRFAKAHDIAQIGELWIRLERQFKSTHIMCSWNWTETWLQHFGDRVDHCFAIGELNGEPAGIALVTCLAPVSVPWLRFRGIVHIGTAGEPRGQSVDVEYNRLLAAPTMRAAFASSLIDAVWREFRPFAIRLDGFVPDDLEAMRSANVTFTVADLPCPVFDLEGARRQQTDILSSLGSGVRSRIRRSNRGFAEGAELHREWATTTDQALDIYDELKVLHQARWEREGRRGAFASTRFTGFHREFIRRSMGEVPRVMLFRLRHGGTTIGCLYGFIEHGMVLFYQSGFIEVSDNRLKPGLSTHFACLEQCLEWGMQAYNFLAGEARYKRELANTEMLLQSATAFRYPKAASLLDSLNRLGLVEGARSIKRWRERRSVAPTHAHDQRTRQ